MSAADVLSGQGVALPHARVVCACAHCGLDVPAGLVDAEASRQFCCGGCRAAYAILHEHGLDRYYDFAERRGAPVRSSGRRFEEFDHTVFQNLYVRALPNGLVEAELYLEGVHCASCVWLVERSPLVIPGVVRAELEIRRSLARVSWDPTAVRLSAIARTLDSLGYTPHPFRGVTRDAMRRAEDRAMLVRIGVAGAIAINVMLAALALYSGWAGGMDAGLTRFLRWVSLGLVTPAMVWPGRVFLTGAWSALRARTLHMDVPIAIGLVAGYVQGAVNTISGSGPVYFDGLATLIFALLVGRYLQQRGQRAAADSTELLFSLTPGTARVVEESGELREVPTQALLPGMRIDVRAGETLAADGVIVAGETQLDVSLLTGESRPVAAREGDEVFAGTVNLSAPVRVRATQTGEASRVAKIMRQVEESAARRAPVVQLANRTAVWFVAVVLVLAVVTFLMWRAIDPSRAVATAVALLIVTCPCALALSTPLAVSVAVGRAARAGMFVKGGDALESLGRPGQLILDKTGTITEGRTALVRWEGADWVRPLVLGLEEGSSHPIANAFRGAWSSVGPAAVRDVNHVVGGGIVATVDGHRVVVGSPAFVARHAPAGDEPSTQATPVVVAVDGTVVARAWIGDPVRGDARQSIAELRARGWSIGILSGDAPSVVRSVGAAVGVAAGDCIGAATPETKRRIIEERRRRGPVVMVGDGVNDAAAMAAASVGIGVHGGAEACLASADVYLTRPGLAALVELTDGARRTLRVIKRNVAFSLAYNVVGVSLAMSGRLTPLAAALLMPASSLTVVLASWRSRTFRESS
jgi:Cu2+-exporting ATPase